MKTKIMALLFVLIVMSNQSAQSQVFFNQTKTQAPPHNDWTKEEEIFSEVLKLTMKEIEKKTPFRFTKNSDVKAEFVLRLGNSPNPNAGPMAQYWHEGPTVKFRSWLLTELFFQYGKPLYKLDTATLMQDQALGQIMWHEATHHLMNTVAQSQGLGIWYTPEYIKELDNEHWLGVHIISEGTAEYIKSLNYPFEKEPDENDFPSEDVTSLRINFERVAYKGGYWLVKPILKKHGQVGMIWMMQNPFVAKYENMRQAGIDYQQKALAQLSLLEQKKPKMHRVPNRLRCFLCNRRR